MCSTRSGCIREHWRRRLASSSDAGGLRSQLSPKLRKRQDNQLSEADHQECSVSTRMEGEQQSSRTVSTIATIHAGRQSNQSPITVSASSTRSPTMYPADGRRVTPATPSTQPRRVSAAYNRTMRRATEVWRTTLRHKVPLALRVYSRTLAHAADLSPVPDGSASEADRDARVAVRDRQT